MLILVIVMAPINSHSSPTYTTKDFNVGNELASVYKCAVTGVKTGLEPKAILYLNGFEVLSKIETSSGKALLEDAHLWYEYEGKKIHLEAMWKGGCKKPFSKLAKLTHPEDDLAIGATME